MKVIQTQTNKKLRPLVYWASFFFTITFALSAYINSSFVEQLTNEKFVGLFFALASALSIIFLIYLPSLINRGDLKNIILVLSGFIFLTLLVISFSTKLFLILLFLLLFRSFSTVVPYLLDVYLESLSADTQTGKIRGFFLFLINLGWLLSALSVGLILQSKTNYQLLYLVSTISFIPFILLVSLTFRKLTVSNRHLHSIKNSLLKILLAKTSLTKDLRQILAIDFTLNFFYALMVIYTPIYLHNVIGLDWTQMSFIFTIMLLPFVLVQYPLGYIADRWLGEKEIIVVGMIIMGLFTCLITFITTSNIWLWALILFMTRVGAASIEVGKETYLFKKIDAEDTSILSIFRILLPFSYLVAPLGASLFLIYFNFNWLFLALAIFTLAFGTSRAIHLRDTK